MKLLLDENLPHQLRLKLSGHDVDTTTYMGRNGIKNGAILRLALNEGFGALVTNDRGLEYQQNLDLLPISVLVLRAPSNTIETLRAFIPARLATLAALQPRTFVKVEAP